MTPRTLKTSTFGTPKSGKTSLMRRFMGEGFQAGYRATIVPDFLRVTPIPDPLNPGATIKMQIWDNSSQENCATVALSYLKTSDVIFYVIDATATSLDDQFEKIRASMPVIHKNIKLNLVLTKMDSLTEAEQKIKSDYVKSFMEVETHSFALYTVSAKNENDLGIQNLLKETINWKRPLSDADLSRQLHVQQTNTVENVCRAYEVLTKKRVFSSTDSSRNATVKTLTISIDQAKSQQDIIAALITAVKDIRTPAEDNRRKYGVTFFFSFLHYGNYRNSQLYKLIKAELELLDPKMAKNLDQLSAPIKHSHRKASVYSMKKP